MPTNPPNAVPEPTPRRTLVAVGALLVALIFATDLLLPLGYAGGMPYSIPLMFGFWAGRRYTVSMAVTTTLLTAIGFLFSTSAGVVTWIVVLNRFGALLTIWVTAIGANLYRVSLADREELRRRLMVRERLAAVGETAATFAHEVGNPLNSIYLHTQLLERAAGRDRDDKKEKIEAALRVILSELQRLRNLLEEFRSLSKHQKLTFEPVEVVELLDHVLETQAPNLEGKDIAVVRDLALESFRMEADGDKLTQVLLNLLKNAAEAMPEGGTLTVRGRVEADGLRLDIADTGVGIPEDVDILEPFTTTKETGTGLGLPVVVQIVTAHGGSVSWDSPTDGGTTFSLKLPVSL